VGWLGYIEKGIAVWVFGGWVCVCDLVGIV